MRKKEKLLMVFLFFIIILQLLQIFYFKRADFLEQYDPSYWKDRFEHSQWQLPLTKRTIGDDGLFEYIGYTLIHGADPSKLNAETGPVGKYFLGLSILLLGNPIWSSFLFGTGSLVVFYLLAKLLFKDGKMAFFSTVLLFLEPLFINQLWNGWVDIFQLFFLLLAFYFLFLISKTKRCNKMLFIFLGGFSLGIFSATKLPLLSPIIFFLSLGYLFFYKVRAGIFLYIFGIIAGFILPYIRYFLLGYSFYDFIGLQKYILSFYLKSRLIVHEGVIWQILLQGKFSDLVSGQISFVSEWWFFWPLVTILGLTSIAILLLKKRNPYFVVLGVYAILALLIFSFIPVYSRYLLLVLPFLILFTISLFWKFNYLKFFIIAVILISGIFNSLLFLQPKSESVASDFYYNLSHQYFQDIFQQDLTKDSKKGYTREAFRELTQKTLSSGEIIALHVDELGVKQTSQGEDHDIRITYNTQNLGSFSEKKTVHFVKEQGRWKVKWDWNLLIDGFKPGYYLETKIIPGNRGTLVVSDGSIIAQDLNGYKVFVRPDSIDPKREQEMLSFLSSLSKIKEVHLQNAYLENSFPDIPVPLFTSWETWNEIILKKLQTFPGITIAPSKSRLYTTDLQTLVNTAYTECCTRIYSSFSYHGASGFEKIYDEKLWGHDGGSLVLRDEKGNIVKTIILKSPKNGQTIQVFSASSVDFF